MLPNTHWLKNLPTSNVVQAGLAYYLFLTRILGLTVYFTDGEDLWNAQAEGADGAVLTISPQAFRITTAAMDPSFVGGWLTIADPLHPLNSGIYEILAVDGDNMGVTLAAPIANFSSDATALRWSVYDPSIAPVALPVEAVAGLPSTSAPPWQVRFEVSGSDILLEVAPNGGWDSITEDFLGPVLPLRLLTPLAPATNLCFAVGSLQGGWATLWTDNGAGVCTALFIGNYNALHNPGILGQPGDTLPVCVMGSAATQVTTNCSRLPATSNSLAEDGTALGADKFTATTVQPLQYLWAGLGTDPFSAGGNTVVTDPRTGQPDAMVMTVCEPTTPVLRGSVPGLYCVNNALTNRTLLNAGTVYVLQNGIGVPWDTTTPF